MLENGGTFYRQCLQYLGEIVRTLTEQNSQLVTEVKARMKETTRLNDRVTELETENQTLKKQAEAFRKQTEELQKQNQDDMKKTLEDNARIFDYFESASNSHQDDIRELEEKHKKEVEELNAVIKDLEARLSRTTTELNARAEANANQQNQVEDSQNSARRNRGRQNTGGKSNNIQKTSSGGVAVTQSSVPTVRTGQNGGEFESRHSEETLGSSGNN